MIIQKLELPQLDSEKVLRELYIRDENGISEIEEESLLMSPGAIVSFDTYFNAFSIEKWMKYTVVDQITVECAANGEIELDLFSYVADGKKIYIKACDVSTGKALSQNGIYKYTVEIPFEQLLDARLCFLKITNISNHKVSITNISYRTDCKPINDVKMAISICTYKRENDLYRNIDLIKNKLVKNKESVLYDNLDVLIVDNGHTVEVDENEKWVNIVQNKNCGGAAGFSRGMMEISRDEKHTHILLMDDDVIIKPSAIEKTFLLLSYMKENMLEYIVGGAMFRRDFPFVQHEAGGQYNNGRITSLHNGKDLRKVEEVIANEENIHIDYNAWWYCCIPIEIVKRKGYALPLFIHQDDIEYGIRAGRKVITMNGINVWHESFEQKRPSSNEYYDVRNILIVNSAMNADYKLWVAIKRVVIRMLKNAFLYRYRDVKLVAKAVDDFCKGPQWLMDIDGEILNEEVRGMGYSYNETYSDSNLVDATISLEDVLGGFNNSQKLDMRKVILLNGNLFPANTGERVIPIPAGYSPHEFYRVNKAWIYDPDTQKGFYVNKDIKEFWHTIGLIITKSIKLTFNYNKMRHLYKEEYQRMCSDRFWRAYLGL